MFKNVWEEVVSWFKTDRYKDKEEVYYLELAKAKLMIEELENIEEDDDMGDWNREIVVAWS